MRQYISDVMPNASGILETDERGFRHLRNVLRVKCGDMVHVRFPDGALREMSVCGIDAKRKVVVLQMRDVATAGDASADAETVVASEDVLARDAPMFWLFMFVAKPQKMELVIRQAAECGVAKIVPVAGEFSQAGNVTACKARVVDGRFQRIIREAREQSGSAVATEIADVVTVSEAAEMWQLHSASENVVIETDDLSAGEKNVEVRNAQCDSCAIVLYEKNENSRYLHEVIFPKIKKAAIAVGCEGGISPGEIEILCGAGFVPVHFDTNILRCETAALYGIAALQVAMLESDLWYLKK